MQLETPGSTTVRCVIIANALAGSVPGMGERIHDATNQLRRAGMEVHFRLVEPKHLTATLEQLLAESPCLVVAAGGDGTVRTVASALLGTEHALGVLPVGTMNRFAQAMGIPLSLSGAVRTLIDGQDVLTDVGEVNGEVFVNTCALGIYPELARQRELRRLQHAGWPRLLRWSVDTAFATRHVLRNWRVARFRLRLDGKALTHRVPGLVITNNPLPERGELKRVGRGMLAIYVPRERKPLGLAWLTLRAILRGPKQLKPLRTIITSHVEVDMSPKVPVALDGEVCELVPPLSLVSRRRACRVRIPRSGGGT